MGERFHLSSDVSAEDVSHALSHSLGADYQVTVASPTTVKVQRGVMTATVQAAHSAQGTDLRVRSFGIIFLKILNALTITPRVRRALESSFPEQAELHKAYRWG
jgi:hypothetical protein